jgi:hypothetical protein
LIVNENIKVAGKLKEKLPITKLPIANGIGFKNFFASTAYSGKI